MNQIVSWASAAFLGSAVAHVIMGQLPNFPVSGDARRNLFLGGIACAVIAGVLRMS